LNEQYNKLMEDYGNQAKEYATGRTIRGADYLTGGTQATAMGAISDADLARLNALEVLSGREVFKRGPAYVAPTFDQARWDADTAEAAAAEQRYVDEQAAKMSFIPETPPPVVDQPGMPTIAPLTEAISNLPQQAWQGLSDILLPESVNTATVQALNAPAAATEKALGLPSVTKSIEGGVSKLSNKIRGRKKK
jgi:hypothetical protein